MAPALTLRLWGARGSVPSPGSATRRFGGNTSCVSARTPSGRTIVLDAGTGVRALGDALGAAGAEIDLFITHAHWDHVQGLPFFAPLYAPASRVRIHVARAIAGAVEQVVRAQMRPPAFPVAFESLPAQIEFVAVADDGVTVDGVRVRPLDAHHPGGAVGWTLSDEDGDGRADVAYLPDNEIAASTSAHGLRPSWVSALRGARLLMHDATYTPDELPNRRGWGHSSWDEAVHLAAEAGVERLVLFHHHPDRPDTAVQRIADDARALTASLGSPLRVIVAAEGLVLHVDH